MEEKKSFWGCLFDLSFSEFITVRIIRVLYLIGIVIAGIAAVVLIVKAFFHGFGMGLLLVIASPVVFVLLVICFRVKMEFLLTLFRIEENTRPAKAESVEATVCETEPAEPQAEEPVSLQIIYKVRGHAKGLSKLQNCFQTGQILSNLKGKTKKRKIS